MFLKIKSLLVFVFLFVVYTSSAQAPTKTHPAPSIITEPIFNDGKEVVEPFNGTFQFIFTTRAKQVFTDDIFKTIELNRKSNEEVVITLSPYCKLRILSRKQISALEFLPFTKSYVFEN